MLRALFICLFVDDTDISHIVTGLIADWLAVVLADVWADVLADGLWCMSSGRLWISDTTRYLVRLKLLIFPRVETLCFDATSDDKTQKHYIDDKQVALFEEIWLIRGGSKFCSILLSAIFQPLLMP